MQLLELKTRKADFTKGTYETSTQKVVVASTKSQNNLVSDLLVEYDQVKVEKEINFFLRTADIERGADAIVEQALFNKEPMKDDLKKLVKQHIINVLSSVGCLVSKK